MMQFYQFEGCDFLIPLDFQISWGLGTTYVTRIDDAFIVSKDAIFFLLKNGGFSMIFPLPF